MNAKISSCDEMYMRKCATENAVLCQNRDPDNMTAEQLRTVLAPFKIKQYKVMPITQNDLLIRYCQWTYF